MTDQQPIQGKFMESLVRNNKQIRKERAAAIGEDAELIYKRQIEDLEVSIKRLEREQENMLDMSPDSATSLKLATNFDAVEYCKTDLELSVTIYKKKIRLDLAKKRYAYLFGGT